MLANFKWPSRQVLIAYAWITLAVVLYVFGIQAIMQVARVLPSGVGAIASLITFVVPSLAPFFGLLYLALNIPLLLIFARKMKRRFLMRTIYFLLVYAGLNGIFVIPELSAAFSSLVFRVQAGEDFNQKIIDLVWPKIVLPAIGGILIGLATALSWKNGGSSGGSDIIIYYVSTRFKKQIGSIGMLVSLSMLVVSFAIFITIDQTQRPSWLTSLVGSGLYVVIASLMVNLVYPRYAKVLVEIHSANMAAIEQEIRAINLHSFRAITYRSGYSGNNAEYISTVMLLMESREFIRRMRLIDPKVWISVSRVVNVVGKFETKSVD